MTPVDCLFLTPEGVPIVGALVEFQLRKSAFNDVETGVLMPRLVTAVTNDEGRCTVSLWNTTELWYVTVEDPLSNTGLSYKFYVPALDAGNASVRLQDIVVEGEISDTPYDEAAIQAIMNAKANALAAQTGAQAAQVVAENAADSVMQALSGVGAIVVQITQIRDEIVQINTGLVELGATITELGNEIIAASDVALEAAHEATIAATHVDGVKTTIDQMAGVIQTQAGQVATAKASVDQTKIDVTTLANQVNTDKGIVTGLVSTVNTQAGQVAQTKTYIDGVNTNVNTKSAAADASAIAAAGSATTATTQAGIATTASGVSTTKAAEALASANAADVSRTAAEAAVVQTGLDAQAADLSATTAGTQAGVATTKAGEAESARGAAVVARNQAVQAATDADTAADLAEAKLAQIISQTTTFGNGWSTVLGIAVDGDRRVFQIVDWTGGAGTKPALGYIGETGIVATAALAMNIRGAQGASGSGSGSVNSVNGVGDVEGNVTLEIGDIPGLADALASAGAVKTVAGVSPDGTGNIPLASLVNALETSFDQAGTAQTKVTALGESLEDVAYSGEFADLNNIPTAFTPVVHGHTIDQITGLQAALDSAGGVKKVNGISPNGAGLVTLTAANVGAEPTGAVQSLRSQLSFAAFSGWLDDMTGSVNAINVKARSIEIDNAAGTYRSIQMKSGGVLRFDLGVDNTEEAGGNNGSNFYFNAFDDDGNYLASMFSISRLYGVYIPVLNIPTRLPGDNTTAAANTAYVTEAVSTSKAAKIQSGGNLNDIQTAGDYLIDVSSVAATNAPLVQDNTRWLLRVSRSNTNDSPTVIQTAISQDGKASFIRAFDQYYWTAWVKVGETAAEWITIGSVNTLVSPGLYRTSATPFVTDAPLGVGVCSIQVMDIGSPNVLQLAHYPAGVSDRTRERVFTRSYIDGVWSTWAEMGWASDIGSLASLNTTNKTNLVAAINEVSAKTPGLTSDLKVSKLAVADSSGGNTFIDFGLTVPSAGQNCILTFHSGGQPTTYDFRMVAVGGSGVAGSGNMVFYGNQLDLSRVITVLLKMPGQSSSSNVVNTDYTGALTALTTTAKGSLVSAINEVNARAITNPNRLEIGTVTGQKILASETYDVHELTLGANTTINFKHIAMAADEEITRTIRIVAHASTAYTLGFASYFTDALRWLTPGGTPVTSLAAGKTLEIIATARQGSSATATQWTLRKGAGNE